MTTTPTTSQTTGTEPVRRVATEPVVPAGSLPGYGPIFNAGLLHHDGHFHLFARAVRDTFRVNDSPGSDSSTTCPT